MNNKEKIQAQIEKLEVELKTLKEEVNKEEEPLIDFSEFIWRNWAVLAIRWKQFLLKSWIDWSLHYTDTNIDDYNNPITYTKTTLWELKKWDVFICVDDVDDMELLDFNILVWVDNGWDYTIQYLNDEYWIETISSSSYFRKDKEVYKFNRY